MKATMVSVIGNDAFKQALRLLAMQRKTTMAVLVREAIDAQFGKDLEAVEKAADVLFADSGTPVNQSVHKRKQDKTHGE